MTNREYIKQKVKEYYIRKVDEADDENLWNDILYTIQEDEGIEYKGESGFDFLFSCSTCEQIFGSCRNPILSSREFDASDNKCSERFYRYLNLERENEVKQ